jgi:hypothetical protein
VTFDGLSATSIIVVSTTVITCLTPAHPVATVDVIVANPGLSTYTFVQGFTYKDHANQWKLLMFELRPRSEQTS